MSSWSNRRFDVKSTFGLFISLADFFGFAFYFLRFIPDPTWPPFFDWVYLLPQRSSKLGLIQTSSAGVRSLHFLPPVSPHIPNEMQVNRLTRCCILFLARKWVLEWRWANGTVGRIKWNDCRTKTNGCLMMNWCGLVGQEGLFLYCVTPWVVQ